MAEQRQPGMLTGAQEARAAWAAHERESAEEAIERSEKHFRTVFNSIDQGLCTIEVLFDAAGRACDYRFLEMNAAFERQTGISDGVGRRVREFAPTHESFWFERYGHIAMTGEAMRFEHQAQALDRYYDVFAFRIDEPEQRHVAVLFSDISQRRRREANLAFLDEISRDLASLSNIRDTMDVVGAKIGAHFKLTRCIFGEVDEAASTVKIDFGWHRSGARSVIGQHRIRDFFTEEFQRTMRSGEIFYINDCRSDTRAEAANVAAYDIVSYMCIPIVKDGAWRFLLSVHSSQLREWRPEELDLMRELTARIATRLERSRAEEALREADRRKDEFLATLAHELRNPLAPIRNSLHILARASDDPAMVRELHGMIDRQVMQMIRLVDDLLEVSRITRGKFELRKRRVDLVDVVRSATETSAPLVVAARHELIFSPPSEPLIVEGDAMRLSQVLANLLNNAAKYTADGGHIWLTLSREGSFALISVRDDGTGIPVDMLGKVFDLFTQVDRTFTRAQGGLGIGLTLVRRLVGMHGGTVEAKSEGPGRGSEFLVRLPLAR
jgi:signal transduction histidine kinase